MIEKNNAHPPPNSEAYGGCVHSQIKQGGIAAHRFDNAKRRRPDSHARQAMLTPAYVLEPVHALLENVPNSPRESKYDAAVCIVWKYLCCNETNIVAIERPAGNSNRAVTAMELDTAYHSIRQQMQAFASVHVCGTRPHDGESNVFIHLPGAVRILGEPDPNDGSGGKPH